jgi:hypothetical protein
LDSPPRRPLLFDAELVRDDGARPLREIRYFFFCSYFPLLGLEVPGRAALIEGRHSLKDLRRTVLYFVGLLVLLHSVLYSFSLAATVRMPVGVKSGLTARLTKKRMSLDMAGALVRIEIEIKRKEYGRRCDVVCSPPQNMVLVTKQIQRIAASTTRIPIHFREYGNHIFLECVEGSLSSKTHPCKSRYTGIVV